MNDLHIAGVAVAKGGLTIIIAKVLLVLVCAGISHDAYQAQSTGLWAALQITALACGLTAAFL